MENSETKTAVTPEQITGIMQEAVSNALAPIVASLAELKAQAEPQTPPAGADANERQPWEAPEGEICEATKQYIEYQDKQPHQGKTI